MALNKKEIGVVGFFVVVIAGVLLYARWFDRADDGTAALESAVEEGGPTSSTQPELQHRNYKEGQCITWEQGPTTTGQRSVYVVDCKDEHLMEFVSEQNIKGQLNEPYPDDSVLTASIQSACSESIGDYLGYEIDPKGRFYVTALRPTEEGWAVGDRTLQCGLGAVATTSLPETWNAPFTGAVKGSDQTLRFTEGTCFNTRGIAIIDCGEQWSFQITGEALVDSSERPTSQAQWADATRDQCVKKTRESHPDVFVLDGVGIYQEISEIGWKKGQRTVQCAQYKI